MNLVSFVLSEDDLNNVCEIYNRERLSATRTLSNWSSSSLIHHTNLAIINLQVTEFDNIPILFDLFCP